MEEPIKGVTREELNKIMETADILKDYFSQRGKTFIMAFYVRNEDGESCNNFASTEATYDDFTRAIFNWTGHMQDWIDETEDDVL